MSSLQEAVVAGDEQRVKDILQTCDPPKEQLKSCLFFACGSGRTNCAALILESSRLSPDIHNDEEFTLLTLSTRGGHASVVDMLLRWDGDVNLAGPMGNTPLHYACSEGYIECCHILLAAGANINAKNSRMDTPLIVQLQTAILE